MKTPVSRYVSLTLLAIGALLLAMGLWLFYEHHVLLSEGVEVQARVHHKEAKGRAGQESFSAQLVPADQPEQSIKVRMTAEQFASLAEGDSVTLAYVPDDPAIYTLGGLGQVRALDGRDQATVVGGVLCLLLGAALYAYSLRRPKPRRRPPPQGKGPQVV
ncbi:DUF3592 domain-containing protein [Pseudomarimonas salicorniae]|uniref:DUF3592 domain-containing protein n=1 Tax=Pseudomarimonas salicorniae TaxID=2933270 RepID=A0ABT0GLG5_9GAMM|nr:DUF3592 domain-containing protein [Lysobacter sp. CAU 1642]MCK7595345.1 DUF3592 domain-containing protein [Lysobacter sp. CAU 1642]